MADPALRTPDPVLKVVPRPGAERRKVSLVGVFKQYRRVILLCVLPLLAGAIALTVYLMGGRYISTDNAYVGAQKVLITPDVAGKINRIDVIEGYNQWADPGANEAAAEIARELGKPLAVRAAGVSRE